MTKLAIGLAIVGTACLAFLCFTHYGEDGTRKGWWS